MGDLSGDDGVQSHGRSLLVWPELLTADGVALLRDVAPLGARIVLISSAYVSPAIWQGEPRRIRLRLYVRSPDDGAATRPTRSGIEPSDHETVQRLHRSCGITPLPRSVLAGAPGWHHVVHRTDDGVRAVASAQLLAHPVGGLAAAPQLACAIAVHPDDRGTGLGRQMVDGLFRQRPGYHGAALVEHANGMAAAFFEATGWADAGCGVEVATWA